MPEREFELYLSLLSRFLRLKPAQRDEISDELRDHLEQRLEELAARGLSRDDAIHRALEEFGDAAELAHHFKNVTRLRQRKLIMRCTYGTAAALAAAVLVATGFWPQSPHSPLPGQIIAQDLPAASGGGGAPLIAVEAGAGGGALANDDKSLVEAKLARPIAFDFDQTPLNDVFMYISEHVALDILVDSRQLADADVTTDTPISLKVTHTSLSARATLNLILEPLQLCYTIRDGLIVVGTIAANNEIEVYNVRDLVPINQPAMAAGDGAAAGGMMGGMGGGGGGFFSVESLLPALAAAQLGQFGGGGAGGMGAGGFGGMGAGHNTHTAPTLADLIANTIDPESWSDVGGTGSIMEYNGMLVVKNSQPVHAKVKKLLEMMRKSIENNAAFAPDNRG